MELGYRELHGEPVLSLSKRLGVCAAWVERSGDGCAAACRGRRGARSVVGFGPGLPDDRPPALLEPSCAERGGQAAEIAAVVCEA